MTGRDLHLRYGNETGALLASPYRLTGGSPWLKVVCVFGTRPELIKFLPVLRALQRQKGVTPVTVLTSQHKDLVKPLIHLWNIKIDHDLDAMVHGQSLNSLMARILVRLDDVLDQERPDIVLVQGDTTSALAGATAAWHRQIPVGHIEAGLRSGSRESPFPEEVNRRLISALASLHFAPTKRNVATLLDEGTPPETVLLTGNPIVDAVELVRRRHSPSPEICDLLARLAGHRMVLLTTHRRESFGQVMRDRLRVLRAFVQERSDVSLVFPVHANPCVTEIAAEELGGAPRVHLLEPLSYPDFLHCIAASWLVVSDSGGVQEEAPSLGKPLLILRENTERPEAVDCGVARLVGASPQRLRDALIEAEAPGSWATQIRPIDNPFGTGDSALRIVDAILKWAGTRQAYVEEEGEPAAMVGQT